jgi:hypothetical protein
MPQYPEQCRAGQMFFFNRLSVGSRSLARRRGRSCDFRQPEIQNLGMAALGHEYVRWFDVTTRGP